jgi:hypothetical protein
LSTPIGAASPLWYAFAGAAALGVSYWWMTRWMRPTNLEAVFAAPVAEGEAAVVEAAEVAAPIVAKGVAPEPLEPEPIVAEAASAEPDEALTDATFAASEALMEVPAALEDAPEASVEASPKPKSVRAAPRKASPETVAPAKTLAPRPGRKPRKPA